MLKCSFAKMNISICSPFRYTSNVPPGRRRQAWEHNDGQQNVFSKQRSCEAIRGHHLRETGQSAGRQSETTEQEMNVGSSNDSRRQALRMKNIEELFLKLEGLPTLIQNSKQELKQSFSSRVSDDTLKLREEIEKLTMENQALKTDHISSVKSEENIRNLQLELKNAKQMNDKHAKDYFTVNTIFQKAVADKKALEQTLKDTNLNLEKIKNENKKIMGQLATLQDRYQAANDERVKMEKELSESKTRLSRLMGNKLGDNNPDIADLSDKNRPTKIAEKYTELYDNEWTDAFDVFHTRYNSEKEVIDILLEMLLDIKDECDKITDEQEQKLTEAMKMKRSSDCLPDHIYKQLKDFRRFTAEQSLPEVIDKCCHKLRWKNYGRYLNKEDVLRFFKGCVQLCWFMNAQDPPLAFCEAPLENEEFDLNTYKYYTSTGSNLKYLVWPALLLKKDGAVLSKGVAQASGPKKMEPQKNKNRNAETGRNEMGSASYDHSWDKLPYQKKEHYGTDKDSTTAHSWDNLPHQKKEHNRSDKDIITTHTYHDNDTHSPNHDGQSKHNRNYQQSAVSGSWQQCFTKTFSRTLPGHSNVTDKVSNNFGNSQREDESGPQMRKATDYQRDSSLVYLYGKDNPNVKAYMGEKYDFHKDYYLQNLGNKSSQSDV